MILTMDGKETTAEQAAFEMFAGTYPHEAYMQDKKMFCDFVRTKNPSITDEQVRELLADTDCPHPVTYDYDAECYCPICKRLV